MKQLVRLSLRIALTAIALAMANNVTADVPVDYLAETILTTSTGDFAPYFIASNRHGILTQGNNALLRVDAAKEIDTSRRFSYGFGVQALAGWSSAVDYLRYDKTSKSLQPHGCHPPYAWIQELYGEIKYRGVFLTVGMKEHESALLNFNLSSGDLVESGNARPVPEVRAGFIDFQDIPFTKGALQIQGEIGYGKMLDNGWMKSHYNYYNYHYNLGALFTYKRCYFRTKPSLPFSATFGMQSGGMFGGTTYYYKKGEQYRKINCPKSAKTFFKMFFPIQNEGSDYYDGNSLGSWDVMFRYRFRNGAVLKAYVEKPWEDGSGIGWMNGFDGVWGLEYQSADPKSFVQGAVVEYLDFTNQSGPIHWYPGDSPGTTISNTNSTGGDMYYNNHQQNPYMYYGMSIGTPFLRSPLYNTDGYMAYVDNRVRGFHAAMHGWFAPSVSYRLIGSFRKGWGDGRIPTTRTREATTMMLEGIYHSPTIVGLAVKCQIAFDTGTMYGNNLGACLSVSYAGNLLIR